MQPRQLPGPRFILVLNSIYPSSYAVHNKVNHPLSASLDIFIFNGIKPPSNRCSNVMPSSSGIWCQSNNIVVSRCGYSRTSSEHGRPGVGAAEYSRTSSGNGTIGARAGECSGTSSGSGRYGVGAAE